MVKNTGGGKYAKKQASKHSNNSRTEELRKSQSPDEVYACVSQNFGNRLDVITIDGETLNCRMGGKFTGRNEGQLVAVKVALKARCFTGCQNFPRLVRRKNARFAKHIDVLC